jgi:hypothetical protein
MRYLVGFLVRLIFVRQRSGAPAYEPAFRIIRKHGSAVS